MARFEGKKASFNLNGQPIGYATGLTGEEQISHEPVEPITERRFRDVKWLGSTYTERVFLGATP